MLAQKRIQLASLMLLTAAILTCLSCGNHVSQPQEFGHLVVQGSPLSPGRIVQVDEYPLFVMNFDGDYGFTALLKTGSSPTGLRTSHSSAESPSWGCTCFSAMQDTGKAMFARNFDYFHHVSLVLFTHPTSAFASISTVDLHYLGFSQQTTLEQIQQSSGIRSAPLLPFDGVNEQGVAIGMMAIPSADPPYDRRRASLSCLEIIRLVLDYASTTGEAVSLIGKYNYRVDDPPVHFLIGDKTGVSAVIEFVNQDMKVMYNVEPFQVSTNFIIFGSTAPGTTSCWRYNKAYSDLKSAGGKVDGNASMDILHSVSQSITMWSAVYDMNSFSLKIAVDRKYQSVYDIKTE